MVGEMAAGVRYREYEEAQDGEIYQLHVPVNPEILERGIAKVFTDLGFIVEDVYESGYQTMWDDDIEYTVTTEAPPADEKAEGEEIRKLARASSYRAPERVRFSKEEGQKKREAYKTYEVLLAVPPALLAKHLDNDQVSYFLRLMGAGRMSRRDQDFWRGVQKMQLDAEHSID